MKKLVFYLLAVAVLAVGPISCSKDDETPAPALASAPEADAAEDGKSGGIYKGALIGSTGIIKITLQKGVKQVEITLDGVKKTLTTTDLDSWTSGEAIVGAEFKSGDWTVIFSINDVGESGSVGFSIPGHPNLFPVIIKENSNAQVKAYEGTFAGSDTGTFNFIEKSGYLYGISRPTSEPTSITEFYGIRTGNAVEIQVGSDVTAVGTIDGNSCSGTWEQSADFKGTWSGKRTL